MTMRDIEYYMRLPYTVILRRDEEGDFVARVDELPGCSAHGKDPKEAVTNLEEARRVWITDCLESGDPIPEPATEEPLPSGKWVQRVPRSLHRKLVRMAKAEGVSLNQLVTAFLSEAAGVRGAQSEIGKRERAELEWATGYLHLYSIGEFRKGWSISESLGPTTPRAFALRTLTGKLADKMTFAFSDTGVTHEEETDLCRR
jgi:antitoxin HicB